MLEDDIRSMVGSCLSSARETNEACEATDSEVLFVSSRQRRSSLQNSSQTAEELVQSSLNHLSRRLVKQSDSMYRGDGEWEVQPWMVPLSLNEDDSSSLALEATAGWIRFITSHTCMDSCFLSFMIFMIIIIIIWSE